MCRWMRTLGTRLLQSKNVGPLQAEVRSLKSEQAGADVDVKAPAVQRRTSPRANAGQPPWKYLVDQIKSILRMNRFAARIAHWGRIFNPVKELALLKLVMHNRNARS